MAYLVGLATGLSIAAAVPIVERWLGWPEEFWRRSFERRVRRLRRRFLRTLK